MNPLVRFLLLAFVCILSPFFADGCTPTTSEPAEDPVVVILRDGAPACSGVAVGPHEVLTAAHCVSDVERVAYVTATEWRYSARGFQLARIDWINLDRDLARLHVEFNFAAPVKLRAPVAGEPVRARSVLFDATSSGNLLPGEGFFRDSTITVIPGWSGSPVFGDDGRVVGLVRSCRGGIVGMTKICLPDNAALSLVVP